MLSLEKEIQELKEKREKRRVHEVVDRETKENLQENSEPNNKTINTDILILADSNTKYIKEDILDNKKTCKKVFCATYTDIQLFCREMTITKQPEKILLHCGCNDIDRNKKDKPKIFGDIDETLKILQKHFPKSKIIISTLFPQGERDLINIVNDINNHLIDIYH